MFICFTLGLGACQHQDMVDWMEKELSSTIDSIILNNLIILNVTKSMHKTHSAL